MAPLHGAVMLAAYGACAYYL